MEGEETSAFIRKWIPKFKDMPSEYANQPWELPIGIQEEIGVSMETDYPILKPDLHWNKYITNMDIDDPDQVNKFDDQEMKTMEEL